MNVINALSVPFYEFRCDTDLTSQALAQAEKTEFLPPLQENYGVQLSKTLFYNQSLINWFEECVAQVKDLHFDQNYKIEITNCWATKTNFASKHHSHRHNQSIIGGIFYLQDSDVAETFFMTDNPWHEFAKFFHIKDQTLAQNKIVHKIKQEKGKLILYPGHLLHGTEINKDRKTRYTIAFDSFFSGRSTENAEWPYFEIKTTNVHESYRTLSEQKI